MMNKNKKLGASIVEVIIAIAIFTLVAPSIILMISGSHTGALRGESNLEATGLAQQGVEAVRAIRDYSWEDVTEGVHGLTSTGGYWELTGTPDEDLLDKYQRTITVNSLSSYKKEVIVEIGWELMEGLDQTVVMTTRLTNWKVLSWIQTLIGEFTGGTVDTTEVVNVDGGEVQLEALPDWTSPQMLDSYNTDEHYDGYDVFVDGNYAYVATERPNQGDDPGLYIFDISTPSNITLAGYYNFNANVYSIYVSGNYVYLATGLNNDELTILDVSNKADPIEAGSYNSDENKDGLSVYVVGDTAYLGTENNFGKNDHEFYILDVADKENINKIGSYNVYNNVWDIEVHDGYAYLATARLFDEMIILDVSSPSSIQYKDSFNEFGYYEGKGLYYENDTVYFATTDGWWGSNDFYILDVTNKSNITKTSSMDLGGDNEDVYVCGNYAYVATDINGEELTIIDISTPSSPSVYGYYDADGDVSGVYCNDDYAFIAADNDGNEFQIIQPSASSSRYNTSGTFTSDSVDTGSDTTTYYSIAWTEGGNGDLTFQIRTANTEGNLSSATWVGPDGSGALYYDTSGASITLDSATTGSRWIQYKAYFSGDGDNSPILEDITIDYVQ